MKNILIQIGITLVATILATIILEKLKKAKKI